MAWVYLSASALTNPISTTLYPSYLPSLSKQTTILVQTYERRDNHIRSKPSPATILSATPNGNGRSVVVESALLAKSLRAAVQDKVRFPFYFLNRYENKCFGSVLIIFTLGSPAFILSWRTFAYGLLIVRLLPWTNFPSTSNIVPPVERPT